MERICEYCKSPFTPKRTDAVYCSASCRQLAYVLRKAISTNETNSLKGLTLDASNNATETKKHLSIQQSEHEKVNKNLTDQINELTFNEKEPSINREKIDAYPSTEEKTTVNTDKQSSVNIDTQNPTTHKAEENEKKEKQEEYIDYESSYISEVNTLIDKRDTVGKLFSLSYSNVKPYALWLNTRVKCLVECLLTFSERQEIELDDLKEVCNAFTAVIQSRYFDYLGLNYPYHKEIIQWRDTVKKLCVNADPDEPIALRLKKETRQTLLVTRFELANNAPKISFSKLNFKE